MLMSAEKVFFPLSRRKGETGHVKSQILKPVELAADLRAPSFLIT